MSYDSEYCPLCGAHELEWHEGESIDDTVLAFKMEIKKLHKRLKFLEDKNGKVPSTSTK